MEWSINGPLQMDEREPLAQRKLLKANVEEGRETSLPFFFLEKWALRVFGIYFLF